MRHDFSAARGVGLREQNATRQHARQGKPDGSPRKQRGKTAVTGPGGLETSEEPQYDAQLFSRAGAVDCLCGQFGNDEPLNASDAL
jgi:hypothetical protein